MKLTKILTLGLLALTFGCSNPNSECIDKIKQQVKENAMGIEMNYRNIEFQWVDTLHVNEKLASLNEQFDERLKNILDIEFYVKDNFETGKLFKMEYLTKDRFTELRNWEKHNRGIPFNKEYNDYYKFAFDNRNASAWLYEFCNQIEETDSLLNNYDNFEDGNLDLIQNALWYYKRIDDYHSNKNSHDIWDNVGSEIKDLKKIKIMIDSLSELEPNKVIHYKALNTYKINNPLLNGAEQEIKKYFIFNSNFEIIEEEEIEN
ncbi:MAG: hypothetical protein RBR97_20405 [Bacteroidales bacterium]|nr:hypothetical protein [Bacteroidales bacterium]